ncbi:NAD(P)-dependent alcohol dehydrogenase [Nocardioides donggukensis]|uniref:NAD(P)-dependent alcohol dehydrogenase n=1 Tax=Nocardioides donggukensis TaxID=2774019 RepID=A0A927K713_9ACTN|nr:NAD(P)-dependent alcohol dehydrogenase [Nocardioides donggukensis]MBD8870335.1 NAD(P)-dependent alcohol dehydrogenase [Nocardioides donggukensis]
MRAIVQERYGDVDTLELREVDPPVPGPDQVLVRVRAAGVDRGTWHLMTGLPLVARLGLGLRRPKWPTPGRDLAGVVDAVGEGVTRFAIGDEVFGTAGGSFADLAVAPEKRLALKPAALSFEEAAAVPVSAMTALQGLRRVGRVRAGQSVLVTGASGGVGSYAVQLAKAFGAEVTGEASGAKLDLVRSLGADHVIDYTTEELGADGRRYDLVLDIAGQRPLRRMRRLVTPRGTLVIVGGENGERWLGGIHRQLGALLLSPFVRQRLASFVSSENAADLETLADLAEQGAFRPALDQTFPLEAAAKAISHLASGHARGKIVVVP